MSAFYINWTAFYVCEFRRNTERNLQDDFKKRINLFFQQISSCYIKLAPPLPREGPVHPSPLRTPLHIPDLKCNLERVPCDKNAFLIQLSFQGISVRSTFVFLKIISIFLTILDNSVRFRIVPKKRRPTFVPLWIWHVTRSMKFHLR